MTRSTLSAAPRRGLNTIELLGCLVAVAGGVWIGATYVGLDLQGAAYQALDETELLTQIPEDWRPTNPDCPNGDCPDPEEVREEERRGLRAEFQELKFEVARLAGGVEHVSPEQQDGAKLSPDEQLVRDRTTAYWQELSRIVFEVTSIQQRVVPFAGSEQHSRAIAIRSRALEYGQQAIQLLNHDGIDTEALATGVRVGEWLGQGSETLQTAIDLRGHQAIGGRSVPAADVWAQTEAELRMRTELVRRKSAETSTYLTTRYFAEFPPLGI